VLAPPRQRSHDLLDLTLGHLGHVHVRQRGQFTAKTVKFGGSPSRVQQLGYRDDADGELPGIAQGVQTAPRVRL
jgi:hypothetical protein